MADKISEQQVRHVAELANLELTDEQLPYFTDQLGQVMDLFGTLNEVNTNDVTPTYSVSDQLDKMREDIAKNWGQRDELLENAPDVADGLIRVPAIINESED